MSCRSLALSALAALLALGAGAIPAAAAPRPGEAAPDFTLPRADGGTLSLSRLRGAPIYLNFLASWCPPCNAEAGSVVSLYRTYHRKGLVTIGVDEQEGRDRAQSFIRAHNVPFTVVLDADGAMGRSYGEISLPLHVFIDRSGNVSLWRLGEMSRAEIEAAIRAIL
jgi:peroxiredoxin